MIDSKLLYTQNKTYQDLFAEGYDRGRKLVRKKLTCLTEEKLTFLYNCIKDTVEEDGCIDELNPKRFLKKYSDSLYKTYLVYMDVLFRINFYICLLKQYKLLYKEILVLQEKDLKKEWQFK